MTGLFRRRRMPRHPCRGQEVSLKQPVWKAILTDWHFWLPVAVLVVGIGLLAAVR